MKKNWIKFISFIILTASVVASLDLFVFVKREKITLFTQFFKEEENSLDILFIGSSTVNYGIIPNVIWNEYNLTAYNLTNHPIHPEVILLAIDDIARTQNPQLVFIDLTTLTFQTEANQESYVERYYNSMPESKRKEEIKEMYDYLNVEEEKELFNHHNDYRDLEYYKMDDPNTYLKGYTPKYVIAPLEKSEYELGNAIMDLSEDGERYLKKILDQCKKYPEIQFVFARPPKPFSKSSLRETYMLRSTIPMINDYGYEYIEIEQYVDEMDIVVTTDFYDDGHLNYWGAVKFTNYIMPILIEKYDLKDAKHSKKVKENFDSAYDKYERKVVKKANKRRRVREK